MIREQLTVGVLTPHAAAGPEVELPAISRGRVAPVVVRTAAPLDASGQPSRTPLADHHELLDSTKPAAVEHAAAAFAGRTLAAVLHASTTTGYVPGFREDAALIERLAQRFDLPAVASCAAVVAALRSQNCERVQLVHPPWFSHGFDDLGAAYFRSHGFDAVVTKAVALPESPSQVDPQSVIDWAERHLQDRAEAIFLAGTGLRSRTSDRGAGTTHGPAGHRGQPSAAVGNHGGDRQPLACHRPRSIAPLHKGRVMTSLLEFAGGTEAIHRLEDAFYSSVLHDPLLQPLFGAGRPEHVHHLTLFTAESFGGADRFTRELGFGHLIAVHRGLKITEAQRQRFVELYLAAMDEADLPADAEFRAAVRDHVEFGSRVAMQNSLATTEDELHPLRQVPRWTWTHDDPG